MTETVLQHVESFTFTYEEKPELANDLHIVVVSLDVRIKDKGEFKKGRVVDREVEHEGKPTSRVEFSGTEVPRGSSVTVELKNDKGEIQILGYSWTLDGEVVGDPHTGAP